MPKMTLAKSSSTLEIQDYHVNVPLIQQSNGSSVLPSEYR